MFLKTAVDNKHVNNCHITDIRMTQVCTSVGFLCGQWLMLGLPVFLELWKMAEYCAIRERDKTPVKILVFVIVYQNIIAFLTSGMTFLYSWHHQKPLIFQDHPTCHKTSSIQKWPSSRALEGYSVLWTAPEDLWHWHFYFQSKYYLDNVAAKFRFIAVKIQPL